VDRGDKREPCGEKVKKPVCFPWNWNQNVNFPEGRVERTGSWRRYDGRTGSVEGYCQEVGQKRRQNASVRVVYIENGAKRGKGGGGEGEMTDPEERPGFETERG
jgi:hypothetical protein